MKEICETIELPLILHGGTGIPTEQIKKSISLGTAKINVNTENQIAFTKAVRTKLNTDFDVYDPRKFIGLGREAIREAVIDKIRELGSSNKA